MEHIEHHHHHTVHQEGSFAREFCVLLTANQGETHYEEVDECKDGRGEHPENESSIGLDVKVGEWEPGLKIIEVICDARSEIRRDVETNET